MPLSLGTRVPLPAAAVALVLTLGSCGAGRDAVVVRVGNHSITERTVEHWTAVEAILAYEASPSRPAPKGVVPDPPAYADCVAYLHRIDATLAQLKRRCQQRYDELKRHVLDILITNYWLDGEAAARGVTVNDHDVQRAIKRQFPTPTAFRRFLALTGERASDETLIVRRDLLAARLQASQLSEVTKSGLAPAQERQAFAKLGAEFTARWTARTDCRPEYVVQECRQFDGPASPSSSRSR
jgi:hypothetical protein